MQVALSMVLVVGAMFVALIALFTVPLSTQFFQLVDPGEKAAWALTGFTIAAILVIEVIRLVQLRFVRRSLAQAAGAAGTGARRK